jgi:succinate dehydrogenase flavin-adding protein (antitoxin of CptAB toxin-antitoxin module)
MDIIWAQFVFGRIDKLKYAELKELRHILGHHFVDLFDSKGMMEQYVPLYPTAWEG